MFRAQTTIVQDWRECKDAHTAAREHYALERAWGSLMKGAATPALEYLRDKALDFQFKHGIEFDPRQSVVLTLDEGTRQ